MELQSNLNHTFVFDFCFELFVCLFSLACLFVCLFVVCRLLRKSIRFLLTIMNKSSCYLFVKERILLFIYLFWSVLFSNCIITVVVFWLVGWFFFVLVLPNNIITYEWSWIKLWLWKWLNQQLNMDLNFCFIFCFCYFTLLSWNCSIFILLGCIPLLTG